MAMITEIFLAAVCFHLIIFTDFVPDKDIQFFMGFSFMFFIICLLGINIFFVVKEMFRLFKLKMIKKWKLYIHNQEQNQEPRLKHQQFMLSLNNMIKQRGIQVIEPNPNVMKSSKL